MSKVSLKILANLIAVVVVVVQEMIVSCLLHHIKLSNKTSFQTSQLANDFNAGFNAVALTFMQCWTVMSWSGD